jgi:hypothetical protein
MLVGTPDKGIPAKRRERISNVPASITVVVTADLSARMVEYRYESDQEKTAVPEKGILTFRSSDASVDLYSRTNGSRPSRPTNSFGASTLSPVADRPGIHGNLGGAAPDFMSLILQQWDFGDQDV